MERITLSDYGRFKIPPLAGTKGKERPSYMDLYCRLAAYEDTGLEPAEWAADLRALDAYRALGSVDRLRELAQADREGRCVILPCKRGDTVWFIKSAFSVAAFPIEANHVSIRGIDCDGDVLYAAITDYNKIERHFKSSDISKTVFLTRAEAEAALRREQDGQIKP